MAKKGEQYAQVRIDLARWAQDYMRINNLQQTELADRLNANRARITDMVKGRQNTMKYLQIVVNSIYGGDYSAMGRYAMDESGERVLATMNLIKNFGKSEDKALKRLHDAFIKVLAQKDMEKIRQATKIFEG